MRRLLTGLHNIVIAIILLAFSSNLYAAAPPIADDERCPVCGMFVGKYQEWLTRIEMSNGTWYTFDGVKDMMAYYYEPQKFGAEPGAKPVSLIVKDYYTLDWIDGKSAFYIVGGDILGPMGHELIPFGTHDAAENFMTDHRGERILNFSDITKDLIDKLRQGHKMKGMHK